MLIDVTRAPHPLVHRVCKCGRGSGVDCRLQMLHKKSHRWAESSLNTALDIREVMHYTVSYSFNSEQQNGVGVAIPLSADQYDITSHQAEVINFVNGLSEIYGQFKLNRSSPPPLKEVRSTSSLGFF